MRFFAISHKNTVILGDADVDVGALEAGSIREAEDIWQYNFNHDGRFVSIISLSQARELCAKLKRLTARTKKRKRGS